METTHETNGYNTWNQHETTHTGSLLSGAMQLYFTCRSSPPFEISGTLLTVALLTQEPLSAQTVPVKALRIPSSSTNQSRDASKAVVSTP